MTMLIKSYEEDTGTKQRARTFDEVVLKKLLVEKMVKTFWKVRQAIAIVAFFGGLRLMECLDLKLEEINSTSSLTCGQSSRVTRCRLSL